MLGAPPGGRVETIARYVVLALLAGQALGVAALGLFILMRAVAAQSLYGILLSGGMALLTVFAVVMSWFALHRCDARAAVLGLGLLVVYSVVSLGTVISIMGEGEGLFSSEEGLAALAQHLQLWAMALFGLWLAARERRRRLDPPAEVPSGA